MGRDVIEQTVGSQVTDSYDVAVVGLGPAGSTAATLLSRAGLRVAAFDKAQHPRYKVCGGGLSTRIAAYLDPGFHSVVEHTITAVRFVYRGQDPQMIRASEPIAYMVMRDRFDQYLVQQTAAAGVDIRTGEGVTEVAQDAEGVDLVTVRGRYRAKVLIGADGANGLVARRLFPSRPPYRAPALESEVPLPMGLKGAPSCLGSDTILVDVGVARQGYGWMFPKQGAMSVGVGEFRRKSTGLHATFQRFMQGHAEAAQWSVPRPIGHPIPIASLDEVSIGLGVGRFVQGRALLVGDAAQLADPLFGEGIYYAVRSGLLAAQTVLDHIREAVSLTGYAEAIDRELMPDFRATARIATVIYTFPRLGFRLMRRYEDVVQGYFQVLQGKISAERFLVETKQRLKTSVRELLWEAIRLR